MSNIDSSGIEDSPVTVEPTRPGDDQSGTHWIEGFILREAVIFAIATAGLYLFAFQYQQTYLREFGIDDAFVEVSIKSILLSGVAAIAAITLIWNVLSLLSPNSFRQLLAVLFSLIHLWLILAVIFLVNDVYGFNWYLICLLILFTAAICEALWSGGKALKNGEPLFDWAARRVRAVIGSGTWSIQDHIFKSVNLKIIWVFIIFIAGIPLLATMAGLIFSTESRFMTYTASGKEYAIVSNFESGVVAVGIVPIDFTRRKLTGEVRWVSLERLSNYDLSMTRVPKGLERTVNNPSQISFSTFWRNLFDTNINQDRR